jgi:hypothetical protein
VAVNTRPSFFKWLRAQVDRDDPIGDLARDYVEDKCSPRRGGYPALASHIRHAHHRDTDSLVLQAAARANAEWSRL